MSRWRRLGKVGAVVLGGAGVGALALWAYNQDDQHTKVGFVNFYDYEFLS